MAPRHLSEKQEQGRDWEQAALRYLRRHGGAAASITPNKIRRLIRAAQVYLQRLPTVPPCRFDVVAIDGEEFEWLRDAIQV